MSSTSEPAERSIDGKLTAVAVLNVIVGSLHLVTGGFFFASYFFLSLLDLPFRFFVEIEQSGGDTPFSDVGRTAIVRATAELVIAVLQIACGIGLLGRRHWAVALGLVLGVIAALLAVLSLANFHIVGTLWYGAYACVAIYVLNQVRLESRV